MLRKEKLWKPKWDSFRPCHHWQVGGKAFENHFCFLSFVNLSSEYWSCGLCRKVHFMLSSRHDVGSTWIFLFWLAFLGRSQSLPFWIYVFISVMGFFSGGTGFSLTKRVCMVRGGRGCHLSYLAGQGLSQLCKRGSAPPVSGSPFIILSDCCWAWWLPI